MLGWTKRGAIVLAVLLFAAVALVAAACGGSDDNGDEATQAPTSTTAGPATATRPADSTPAATEEPVDGPPTSIEIEARDSVFDVQPAQGASGTIEAAANSKFSVLLVNEGVLPHNIAFLTKEGGAVLSDDANGKIILEAESDSITFTTPGPGTYYFQCSVHPQEMFGDFIVK